MATFYEPDQRGGYRVTLPNGTRVPMMLSEEKLRQAGALPVQDQGPDLRTAMVPVTAAQPNGPPKPEQKADFVRADSPEFQAMLAKNEAAAKAAGNVGMPKRQEPVTDVVIARPSQQAAAPQERNPFQLNSSEAGQVMANAMRPRYVQGREAGFVPTSITQVTEGAPSQENVEKIGAANDKLQGAYALAEQADMELARAQARQANVDAAMKQQQFEDQQRQRQQIDAEVGRRMAEVDARTQAIRNSPDIKTTLWDQAGPVGVVSGFLAVWLGGMARYMQGGGENLGVKALNDTLDRGIEAQRARLAKQGDELTNAKGALAEYTRLHGDPETAAKELKLAQIEAVMSMGDARAAHAKAGQVAANWQIKRAELEALKAKEMADLQAMQTGKVQAQFAYDPGRSGGWVRPGLEEGIKALKTYKEGQDAYAGATGMETPDPEKRLFMGGKLIGAAQSEEEARELRTKVLPFSESMDQTYNDLIHMARSWSSASPEQRARMASSHVFAEMETKGESGFGMGALTEGEKATLDEAVRNPAKFLSMAAANVAGLEQTRDNFRRKTTLRVRAQGIPINALPWNNDKRAD